ncbi:MAG TPA: xanthine dehydrogenase family protein molybdopterin-binding subunit [Burkholderiaceae bacterium]|nr:xanthine dehydrogenase family protein molybdopterin-binding subunit [Burkholderiaceae bacterium]
MSAVPKYGRFGSGREVKRIEDPALVRGQGRFVDDVSDAGQLRLVFLRSSRAHARIKSIDTRAALAMPGVVAIITGRELADARLGDFPGPQGFQRGNGQPGAAPPYPALAVDAVRFVGQGVAAIVAQTRAQAEAARDAIDVDYDDLPAVIDGRAAVAPGATLVWPDAPGNIACEMRHGDAAKVAAAFKSAAHVVSLDLVNQRLAPVPMEPRAVLATVEKGAQPEQDRLTLRMSSQMPSGARDALCDGILHIPQERVRVVVGDVGGGFGMKTGLYPEDAVVAYAALKLRRATKWTAERGDEFLAALHGRDLISRAELALDKDGRILALRTHSLANVGAYGPLVGAIIQMLIGPWVSTSVYDIPLIDEHIQAVLTHTNPTGPYRGAGRPENIYIIERLMDAAARKTGLDAAEIRRRNLVRPEQMPYKNAMGQTYDSGNFPALLEQGLKLADYAGFDKRLAGSKARGKLRGRGLVTFLEWTSGNAFEERLTIDISGDGYIEVYTATQQMGQGIATSYAQLVVDAFDVPIERVRVVMGDTDRGSGFGSAGSRSLFVAGSTLQLASRQALDRARDLAGDALEVAGADLEYANAEFRIAGTDRTIGLFELAARQDKRVIHVDTTGKVGGPSWPNGCHVCEVEVDPGTGATQIVSYMSLNDIGRVVSPMIVRGQLDGGAVQGIGQALCEQVVYDPESGQLLTGSFMDYAMPRADIIGSFTTRTDESTPCKTNPLGAKGVGELGTIGATPAVVIAVIDALARAGAEDRALKMDMPLTPEKVWRALSGK